MDVFTWGLLFLFFCLAVLFIVYGFQRAQGDIADASSAKHPRTKRDLSRKAVQTGNLELLKKAPQPKTLYDLFVDRITQGFIIVQYQKLLKILFPYLDDISTRESTAEIGNLATRLTKMGTEADLAEEEYRRAQAIRELEKLWEGESPEPHQNEPELDTEESINREIDKLSHRHTEIENDTNMHPYIKEKRLSVIENRLNHLFRKLEEI